ncbi:hypothetical protein [Ralstonia pseudosolanacearum]|uniref:hypothetical protein n=1 Tax=Ralstonia pseudosolanacearum TaxID=1310165 RepID=UPI0018D14AEC|nr:hypothetical protein [Ralstonia pseudosolanacearum]UWD92046.1 hypothetical protein NY025_13775 [Ralstonia pseudosolanacearum]CAH0443516.1 hypothetical protein LMG9673_04045 [Ralstonia pseudosolanacearum]
MQEARCRMALGAIAVPVLSGLLFGCAASNKVTGPGALRQTWGTQFEQYGIFAVFPPRADIQVGDIYLTCTSTIEQKFDAANETARRMVPSPMWVASVPGMVDTAQKDGALSKLYKTRVQLPRIAVPTAEEGDTPAPVATSAMVAASAPVATPALKTKAGGTKTQRAAHDNADGSGGTTPTASIFRGRPLSMAMPVSLPEFFSVSGTKAAAEAIVPLPTILAHLGVNASAIDSVQISVPSAESYGLPATRMMTALADWHSAGGPALDDIANLQRISSPLRSGNGTRWCPLGIPQFMVVTEVFATRSIDVSMSFSNAAGVGGGVGLNLPTGSKNAAVWDALSQYFVPQKQGSNGSGSNSGSTDDKAGANPVSAPQPTIDQATAFIKELNALYSKMGGEQTLSYPGAQVTVVAANNAGVSMNRKFEVPVVIGYRGMPLPLEFFDNTPGLPYTPKSPISPAPGTVASASGPDFSHFPNTALSEQKKIEGVLSDNAQAALGLLQPAVPEKK